MNELTTLLTTVQGWLGTASELFLLAAILAAIYGILALICNLFEHLEDRARIKRLIQRSKKWNEYQEGRR